MAVALVFPTVPYLAVQVHNTNWPIGWVGRAFGLLGGAEFFANAGNNL